MENKVAIVTGASSGVGKETVKAFVNQGYTVFGVARRAEQQADLRALGVKLVSIDLSDNDAVVAGMQKILVETDRVDVLANVAGMAINGAIEDISNEQAEMEVQVNALGVMRMVRAVLPVMRQQRSGYIINVSSMATYTYMPLMGWYGASKRLLEGVTDSLRLEVQPFGIKVALIQPGGIATPMTESTRTPDFITNSGQGAYVKVVNNMVSAFAKSAKSMIQPQEVANLIVKIAISKRVRARYQIGEGARAAYLATRVLSNRIYDWGVTRFMK